MCQLILKKSQHPDRFGGGGGQPKRSAWPLFPSFFVEYFPKKTNEKSESEGYSLSERGWNELQLGNGFIAISLPRKKLVYLERQLNNSLLMLYLHQRIDIFIKGSGSSSLVVIARKLLNVERAHQGFSVTSQPTCKISANYLWICTIWNFLFWAASNCNQNYFARDNVFDRYILQFN